MVNVCPASCMVQDKVHRYIIKCQVSKLTSFFKSSIIGLRMALDPYALKSSTFAMAARWMCFVLDRNIGDKFPSTK